MVRRTKAEAEATRTAILDAAEHLFQARGVSRTSLQDMAHAAGVTRGAVYWHFLLLVWLVLFALLLHH